ncbi:MAG: tetratricopeptide repeat protein [Motiliproteus sp.]
MGQVLGQGSRFRRLPRRALLLLAVGVILGLGLLIRQLPGDWTLTTAEKGLGGLAGAGGGRDVSQRIKVPQPKAASLFDSRAWYAHRSGGGGAESGRPVASARQQQVRVLFEHGANLLRQGQYPQARKVLEMLIESVPKLPEAYVNLGFVLYELGEVRSSVNAFTYASQLNPYQSNAYYGAALGYERLLDYEAAMGHMRSFIHLSQADNAFLPKARAALWEWEQIINLRRQASAADQSFQSSSMAITPSPVSGESNAQK